MLWHIGANPWPSKTAVLYRGWQSWHLYLKFKTPIKWVWWLLIQGVVASGCWRGCALPGKSIVVGEAEEWGVGPCQLASPPKGAGESGSSSSFFSIYRSKIRAWRVSCSSCLSGKTFSKTFARESLERVERGEDLFANWDVWPGDTNGGRVSWCKIWRIFLELWKRGRNKNTK